MTDLDFNDRGKANVSFSEFDNYMDELREQGDYIRERNNVTYYYSEGGNIVGRYLHKKRLWGNLLIPHSPNFTKLHL